MKKIISLICSALYLLPFLEVHGADEKNIYRSVLKVRTYEYNSTNNTYSMSQIGSAVAIGSGLLLTNAHVVFNATTGAPDGFYEVCRTIDFRRKPVCFTTGELVAYDEAADLAILRFQEPSDLPITPLFHEKIVGIWAHVIVYGYPGIGWDNISRTEGNVAGYEDPFYKIDGAIDHGNSGGGAFNASGELLGVPSQVKSDNAVIGYMIPITTIRDFLSKKSKWYTKISLKVPRDFKEFIKSRQLGERSTDIINDSNIKTASLKRFGLKFTGKIEGIGTFLHVMNMSNLGESTVSLGCFKYGWALTLAELDIRISGDAIKKYKITESDIGNQKEYKMVTIESLISSEDNDLINLYHKNKTCAATINHTNIEKNKKIIDQALALLTTWVVIKKSYPQTVGFDTQLFRIDKLPPWISVKESPNQGGESFIEIGYFGPLANTGETLAELTQKKKDTLDAYFLGGKDYFDDAPSDANLKPTDYSYETFRKLYEKKYTGNGFSETSFQIETSKSNKKYIIGTTRYKDPDRNDAVSLSALIYSYPYSTKKEGKTEYRELTYQITYEGWNNMAITRLKEFFKGIEPIGDAPF